MSCASKGKDHDARLRARAGETDVSGGRGAFGRWLAARPGGKARGTARGPGSSVDDRVKLVYDESPVGIAFLDLRGNIVDCNCAFLRPLAAERKTVLGRPLAALVSNEDRDDLVGQLSKLVLGTVRAAKLEGVRMPGVDAREVSASIFAGRVEDAGEVSGLIVHVLDATDHHNLEVQLAQSQKMQAIGQLAGGIAHDFNNQLTATLGFCDLLLTRHGPGDPSFDDIMQIRGNAKRASSLVRQLLAFSRKQKLEPVVLDVKEALSDLHKMLGRLLGARIELRVEDAGGAAFVRVDPGQFDQVVINLAVNARDAMPGGGTLKIRTSAVVIDREVRRGADVMAPGSYVLIEVADTGTGIPKEVIGNIFEPFFSTKEVGAGTGLGLSTVHGIVHQTGGFIFVDSAFGDGAVFSIYFPACGRDAGQSETPVFSTPPPEPNLAGGGTILLVEDEDAVRVFAARALRNKGYRVLEATNGENALDVITAGEEGIDLIVTDVVMPVMDGHTLVRMARQELAGVKVILVSGYADNGSDNSAEGGLDGHSAVHFLPKPFSLADLAGKVKEVMAA